MSYYMFDGKVLTWISNEKFREIHSRYMAPFHPPTPVMEVNMYTLHAATAPLDQSSTFSFANSIATIVVVLALLGLYAIFLMEGRARFIALIILAGIILAQIPWLQDLGVTVRDGVVSLGSKIGFNEIASDAVFTLVIVFILYAVAQGLISQQKKEDANNTVVFVLWGMFALLVAAFFTLTWAQEAILRVSDFSVAFLGKLQEIKR